MHFEIVKVKTKGLNDFVDLTEKVKEVVRKSGVEEGIVVLNCMHNTAALLVQEADEDIQADLRKLLESLVPIKERWRHSYEGNINATAHLKQNLLHNSLIFPIKGGKILLGTWQRIFLLEFFEARERSIAVSIIKG